MRERNQALTVQLRSDFARNTALIKKRGDALLGSGMTASKWREATAKLQGFEVWMKNDFDASQLVLRQQLSRKLNLINADLQKTIGSWSFNFLSAAQQTFLQEMSQGIQAEISRIDAEFVKCPPL